MVMTVGSEETSEFLVQSFCLAIVLWVVPGGETDVNIEDTEES